MSVITIAYYPLGLGLQIGEPMSHSGYSSPTKVLVGIESKMWGGFSQNCGIQPWDLYHPKHLGVNSMITSPPPSMTIFG